MANSPANFQRLIDTVLRDLIGPESWAFIDEVIFSRSIEHAQRLENVLERFEAAKLQLHPGKCVNTQPRVQYLGYVLSGEGITASPDKTKAVRQYPTPKGVKDVRAFIGLASFCRRLVPDFTELAKPLTALTRKDQQFTCGPTQQAFESLKERLCSTSVLAFPDSKLPIILTTDASKAAIGAILSQVQNGIERPIAYASRQLNNVGAYSLGTGKD